MPLEQLYDVIETTRSGGGSETQRGAGLQTIRQRWWQCCKRPWPQAPVLGNSCPSAPLLLLHQTSPILISTSLYIYRNVKSGIISHIRCLGQLRIASPAHISHQPSQKPPLPRLLLLLPGIPSSTPSDSVSIFSKTRKQPNRALHVTYVAGYMRSTADENEQNSGSSESLEP